MTHTYLESAMAKTQGAQVALGLCEVAIRDTGADAIAVPDENAVALRSVPVPTSSSCGLTASKIVSWIL